MIWVKWFSQILAAIQRGLRRSGTGKTAESLSDGKPSDVESAPSTPAAPPAAEESLSRSELVEEFFSQLFPDDFQLALPVKKHMVRAAGRIPGCWGQDAQLRVRGAGCHHGRALCWP